MISMPRSQHPAPISARAASHTSRLPWPPLARWHAACCALLCTGCIYLGPITLLVDENVPPEIFASYTDAACQLENPKLQDPLCVYPSGTGEGTKVFVIALDENDDALEFFWAGSMSGPFDDDVPSSNGEFQSSEIELTPDNVIDGELLTCTVSDGESQRATRTWTLVVFE